MCDYSLEHLASRPAKVGDKDVKGTAVWFRTKVDDYAEVYVDGKIDLAFGSSGRLRRTPRAPRRRRAPAARSSLGSSRSSPVKSEGGDTTNP